MDQNVDNTGLADGVEDNESTGTAPKAVVLARPKPKRKRRWLRTALLIAGPLIVIVGGAWWYFSGGRYVSTDNAYVHADMVAISPQVSGPIADVRVHENEHVDKGDVLFQIQVRPFEIAVAEAKANLGTVRQDVQSLKATYAQQQQDLQLAKINFDYAQRTFDRQSALSKRSVVSQATLDQARNALDTAHQQIAVQQEAMQTTLAKLGGSTDTPIKETPQYLQAQAALDKAQLDLAHATVKAPFAGVASNVPQPGQYVAPGGAVMSLVSDANVWIDANFKEIQLTYVKPDQPVEIWVDTYPDKVWRGTVKSVAPATGSEFSVLPAQNATGNWVKVVQRIPVRIAVDSTQHGPQLRAGMSTEVEIDTHHSRLPSLFAWLGGAGESTAEAGTMEAAR